MLLRIRIANVIIVTIGLILFFPFLVSATTTIDLNIIRAIESDGDPLAVNVESRCFGLYQISEICLEDYNRAQGSHYTVRDLFQPAVNERIASWYFVRIAEMLRFYRIPVTVTTLIASYNWGIGHVRLWAKKGMDPQALPAETSRYIKRYLAMSGA